LLATEGIQSMQKYTDFAAGSLDGSLGAGGSREILVRAADLDRARELLATQ
jgi:putative signal transducing protein